MKFKLIRGNQKPPIRLQIDFLVVCRFPARAAAFPGVAGPGTGRAQLLTPAHSDRSSLGPPPGQGVLGKGASPGPEWVPFSSESSPGPPPPWGHCHPWQRDWLTSRLSWGPRQPVDAQPRGGVSWGLCARALNLLCATPTEPPESHTAKGCHGATEPRTGHSGSGRPGSRANAPSAGRSEHRRAPFAKPAPPAGQSGTCHVHPKP